jgi:hypothetical protein
LRYRFFYSVNSDNNLESKNKLWSCDLNYQFVVVDPSGNLVYPPDVEKTAHLTEGLAQAGALDLSKCQDVECVKHAFLTMEPKVYLKPPPCFNCDCKACGKAGGAKGFNLLLMLILMVLFIALPVLGTYLSVSAYLIGAVVLTNFAAIVYCGESFCRSNELFQNPTGSSDLALCTNDVAAYNSQYQPVSCSCGIECGDQINPPSPDWTDSVDGEGADEFDKYKCAPKIESVFANGHTFEVKLAYKKPLDQTIVNNGWTESFHYHFEKDADGEFVYRVKPFDKSAWQQYDSVTGTLCSAEYRCVPNKELGVGEWVPDMQNSINKISCSPAKAAFNPQWSNVSVVGLSNFGTITKPGQGQSSCIEIESTSLLSNPNQIPLWSFNTPGAVKECGLVSGETLRFDTILSGVPARVYGTPGNGCAQALPPEMDPNQSKICYPDPIFESVLDYCDPPVNGNQQCHYKEEFSCWRECSLPLNMPWHSIPLFEQARTSNPAFVGIKYYEAYQPTSHRLLKFCDPHLRFMRDNNHFDRVK